VALFRQSIRISVQFAAIDLRRRWFDHAANILGPYLAAIALTLFFGAVLKEYLQGYVDYLTIGLVVWVFVSSTTVDACAAFARWSPILRYADVPALAIPMSVALRHSVYFAINMTIALFLLAVATDFSVDWSISIKLLAAGAVLIFACFALAALAFLGGGRFRDVTQLVVGVLNVAFLLTPILWKEHFLGRFDFLAKFNPFRYLIEIIRHSLYGEGSEIEIWFAATLISVASLALAVWLWRRHEPRLRYWL
jgi:ABC-type polysaccharide/polyol phosphate export permease